MAAYVNTELKEEERAKVERILTLEAGLLQVGQSKALARAARAREVYTFRRSFPTEKAGNGGCEEFVPALGVQDQHRLKQFWFFFWTYSSEVEQDEAIGNSGDDGRRGRSECLFNFVGC